MSVRKAAGYPVADYMVEAMRVRLSVWACILAVWLLLAPASLAAADVAPSGIVQAGAASPARQQARLVSESVRHAALARAEESLSATPARSSAETGEASEPAQKVEPSPFVRWSAIILIAASLVASALTLRGSKRSGK
ncbi:MAG: hypothetical protein ACYC4R_13790 [Anaerolineae bacterium]